MGTITHKVMQILGDKKLAILNSKKFVNDEELGKKLSLKDCDNIKLINDMAFDYYSSNFPEVNITEADRRTCNRWAEKAVAYNDGILDPRNQNVFATELFFDFEIKKKH